MRIASTPAALDNLPDDSLIKDGELYAMKILGAWRYEHDGKFWEPQQFPVVIIRVGAPRGVH